MICMVSILAFMLSETEKESKMHMYMCAAALLDVCVCSCILAPFKACKMPCKGTNQEQTNYKLCAKSSVYSVRFELP